MFKVIGLELFSSGNFNMPGDSFTASGKKGDHVIKARVRGQRFAFGFWGRVE